MRLILLPCDPTRFGGYNRVASNDLARLEQRATDEVICFIESGFPPPNGFRWICRPPKGSGRKLFNLFLGRALSEVWAHQLERELSSRRYDEIFCGDVIFYRALRTLFPDQPMTVRFHNFFMLSDIRRRTRRFPIDTHFRLTLSRTSALEREICTDKLVHPIFINPEEQRCFNLIWPDRHSELWGVNVSQSSTVFTPRQARLIYYGGTGSHQKFGLRYFIDSVFRPLSRKYAGLEFHLWGDGTKVFEDSSNRVYGHDIWNGEGLPHGGDGLFVIPDLLGGGIKVKTGDRLRDGSAFITTPFGAEGYSITPRFGQFVQEMEAWEKTIELYFSELNLLRSPL